VSRVAVRTPGAGLPARPRLLGPVLAVLAVLLLLGGVGVSLYTELLWFREVDFSAVYTTVLRTRVLLFVVFGLLMAALVGANMVIAYRSRPPFRPMSLEQQNLERYRVAVEPYLLQLLLLGSGVFGLFAGLSAASRWQTWLLWRNGTSFGMADAQFERDISYYAFTYPFQRFVLGFLLTAVILSLLVAAATHYVFGGVRLQTAGEKVSPAARAHLSVLLGLVMLLKAFAYYLDRYGLAFSTRGVVQGPSYTDVNAVLIAKTTLIPIAIICAVLFFANIVVRNILLPAGALALLVVSAVVIGGVYPAYTQQFRVKPNEVEREAPFIARNIAATLEAYQLDDIEVEPYDAEVEASRVDLAANAEGPLGSVRLLDPSVLSDTFRQLQQIRFYYGFAPQLDIDRYDLGNGLQDYVVGARELDLRQLGPDQRGWIQEHLIYTHGRGFVAAPATDVDSNGRPDFVVGNIPPTGPLDIEQSRIYYGELSPEYSVVNTEQGEVDGPGVGEADQALFNYDGPGGVQLSNIFRKTLYALKFREPNLLLSGAIQPDSRVMYDREPLERIQKVAPYLQLDNDPYPAVVEGRLVWIVDGYTTSAGYPYSQRTELGELTADSLSQPSRLPTEQVNYIRNSVKATVDAYSGDIRLYTFDEEDPVLASWKKAFPNTVLPKAEISEDLMAHLRYPEDLFKVQRDLFAQYHVNDPRAFYSKEDFWEIPNDPATSVNTQTPAGPPQGPPGVPGAGQVIAAGSEGAQPPYYLFLQLPGESEPAFSISSVFVARNRPNLSAFMSASSDPDDYGKIRVLAPPSDTIPGPGTVAGAFESNPEVATTLSLLRQGGSSVILGNLLTLPVGDGLLYVEPVYVQASGGESFPLLRKVLVAFGDDVAFEDTLGDALRGIFGEALPDTAATPPPGPDGEPADPSTPPAAPDIEALITQAETAFRDGQEALRNGDFAAYGAAQARLEAALQSLAGASGRDAAASPSPGPASPAPAAPAPPSPAPGG
jgi:uncharacterized membrane protein (UPF0182 family)